MTYLTRITHQDQFSILGVKIDNLTMTQSIGKVVNPHLARKSKAGYFVNAHSLNQSMGNAELCNTLNSADYVFADGSGVRIAARKNGVEVKGNVNGTDMLPLLCEEASAKGRSIYFLGSAPGIALDAAKNLKARFPRLNIAGCHHGFIDADNEKNVINAINASNADILLVGMGTPVQEIWIDKNRHLLDVSFSLAVGGLFDFYSGKIPRAPLFIRKAGFEWVWRLLQEPKEKFRRYVIGNPLFLLRIALTKRNA